MAIAGAMEAPRKSGPLPIALRKVAKPDDRLFVKTHGSKTVTCSSAALTGSE